MHVSALHGWTILWIEHGKILAAGWLMRHGFQEEGEGRICRCMSTPGRGLRPRPGRKAIYHIGDIIGKNCILLLAGRWTGEMMGKQGVKRDLSLGSVLV